MISGANCAASIPAICPPFAGTLPGYSSAVPCMKRSIIPSIGSSRVCGACIGWGVGDTVGFLVLLLVLALIFERLTRGVHSLIGRRVIGLVFMIVFALLASRCGLL